MSIFVLLLFLILCLLVLFNSEHFTDLQTYMMGNQKEPIIVTNANKCLFVVSFQLPHGRIVPLSNLSGNVITVGYQDDAALTLFKQLCIMLNMDVSRFGFTKTNDCSACKIFIVHKYLNDPFISVLDNAFFSIYSYNNLNVHKFKFFFPYLGLEYVDMRVYLPKHHNFLRVQKLITNPLVIESNEVQTTPEANFYSRYIETFQQENKGSIVYGTTTNMKIDTLEEVGPLQKIAIYANQIDGMDIFEKDIIIIGKQTDSRENGVYIVESNTTFIVLRNWIEVDVPARDVLPVDMIHTYFVKFFPYPVYNGMFYKFVRQKTIGTFSHYDHNHLVFKVLEKKLSSECTFSTDCPYYSKNKNYKNKRGGCHNGYCEFPIGYLDGNPYCYNCNNIHDPRCCDDQKNRDLYPDLLSPDYAFEMDEFERENKMLTRNIKWHF